MASHSARQLSPPNFLGVGIYDSPSLHPRPQYRRPRCSMALLISGRPPRAQRTRLAMLHPQLPSRSNSPHGFFLYHVLSRVNHVRPRTPPPLVQGALQGRGCPGSSWRQQWAWWRRRGGCATGATSRLLCRLAVERTARQSHSGDDKDWQVAFDAMLRPRLSNLVVIRFMLPTAHKDASVVAAGRRMPNQAARSGSLYVLSVAQTTRASVALT